MERHAGECVTLLLAQLLAALAASASGVVGTGPASVVGLFENKQIQRHFGLRFVGKLFKVLELTSLPEFEACVFLFVEHKMELWATSFFLPF